MNIFRCTFFRVFLIVSCALGTGANLMAGISVDTIIQTHDGPKSLRVMKVGDKLWCANMANLDCEESIIGSIQEVEATDVIEISMADGVTINVAADQKLFVTHKWVEAKQLTIEDVLFKKDRTFVRITGIRHVQMPMILRFITVNKNQNFWAAENGVLVHNGPISAILGYWATKAICYGTIATAAAAPIAAATVMTGGTAPAVAAAALGGAVSSAAGGSVATGAVLSAVAATGEAGALMAAAGTGLLAAETVASTTALYGAAAVTVAGIESASWTVSGWLLACPLLP